MKLPSILPKKQKKLRATTTTRHMTHAQVEEDAEPTMRLSSAFIVVVILHLVAVGGIYTFESIKTHRGQESAEAVEKPEVTAQQLPMLARQDGEDRILASNSAVEPQRNSPAPAAASAVRTAANTTAPAVVSATPNARPVAAAPKGAGVRDSGTIHAVQKGENPHSIARKYGVEYDALMKLNKIEDPRKLQINQKLKIPAKE